MCGITGYITNSARAQEVRAEHSHLPEQLVRALKRLQSRGYDSAGASLLSDTHVHTLKFANGVDGTASNGSVPRLVETVSALDVHSMNFPIAGIAHTRWASYGGVTVENAHPHFSACRRISIVHNGHLNNCEVLRADLRARGVACTSETDSEVIAVLIGEARAHSKTLLEAVSSVLPLLDGTYGLVILSTYENDPLVLVSHGSPLHIGQDVTEVGTVTWVASEDHALTGLVRETTRLPKESVVAVSSSGEIVSTLTLEGYTPLVEDSLSSRGEYTHNMLAEIQVQPKALENCLRGRIDRFGNVALGALDTPCDGIETLSSLLLSGKRELDIIAQGTSYYAGLYGAHLLRTLVGIRATCMYAADYPLVHARSHARIVLGLSQSGETADTRDGLRFAKSRRSIIVGITNRVGSTIDRDSDVGVHLRAGLETAVASTKAFTAQASVLALMALLLARKQEANVRESECLDRIASELLRLPALVEETLARNSDTSVLALSQNTRRCMFLGRDGTHALAGEAALKMQEVAYIDAHVHHVSELKHGPLALVEPGTPVFCFLPEDGQDARAVAALRHAHARGAAIYTIGSNLPEDIAENVSHHFSVPLCHPLLFPIVAAPIVQLLSYYTGVSRGNDVDQPRNLAKSVTV